PAKDVGGDYFDAIPLTGSSTGICIADVAGKGVAAALLMSNLQATVHGLAKRVSGPAEMCMRVNQMICADSLRLTTFFYAVIDADQGVLRYCNAGHIPPFLARPDGSVMRLPEGGMILGVD